MIRWILILAILVTVVSCQYDGCKSPAIINATDGTITSPYYNFHPEFSYLKYSKCRWSITGPEGKNTRITFSAPMDVEYSFQCSYDWVVFFEGSQSATAPICSRRDPAAGPLCGKIVPESFVLKGNHIVVEFCSDGTEDRQGFQFTFNSTDDAPAPIPIVPTTEWAITPELTTSTPIPVVCGRNITIKDADFESASSNLYFESPNYPEMYPNNSVCTWYISGPVGQGLSFTAETFDLDGIMCNEDWLSFTEITEGKDVSLGSFCGKVGPKRFRSINNQVRVNFISNHIISKTGFRIRIHKPKCALGDGFCPTAGNEEICFKADSFCDGKLDCPGGTDEVCPLGCGTPLKKPFLNSYKQRKIVGGIAARPHSWPWQVSMLNPDGSHRCGASIIDHRWILTAAHCCEPVDATYKIRVGQHDVEDSLEPNAWTYDLERVIMYPEFGYTPALHHDFALLKTVMPIFFNEDVFPICLGSGTETPVGTDCFVTGWGLTAQRNHTSAISTSDVLDASKKEEKSSPKGAVRPLRQVDVKITSFDFCNAAYSGLLSEDVICAYNPGKDSCQMDSGGPLFCPSQWDANTFEQVGVVSGGRGCASEGIPGLYAKISYFQDWISETIMNN